MANNRNYKKSSSNGGAIAGAIALAIFAVLMTLAIGWGSSWFTDWSFSKVTETVSAIFSSEEEPAADPDSDADGTDDADSEDGGAGTEDGATDPDSTSGDDQSGSEEGDGSGEEEAATTYSITYNLSGVTAIEVYDSIAEGEAVSLYFIIDSNAYAVNEMTVTGAGIAYSSVSEPATTASKSLITLIIADAVEDVTVTISAAASTL